ncbi:MAG: tetratricopeptide repeat protein [Alphaproteobacteria bacterium]|nr:tetratricopeptide repeat protein [Alphaproteobacteria bacterium]MBN2675293.1 tetratricopeptide repeat protein [Alphaproteobacteria bacterium]
MKNKKSTKKKLAPKKTSKPVSKKTSPITKNIEVVKPHFNAWSLSIYVYWFIIIFFISATFYILGRSHGILHPITNNVEITEEALIKPNQYLNSGKEKLLAGNIDEAISDLTAAIETDNPSVDAFILRGEAYMQSGKYNNAVEDFNTAVEIDSLNSVAFYDRALLYTRMEDYSSALSDINNALAARAVRPNDVLQLRDIYAKRGQLNLWLKNWDGAIADYTNSLARPEGVVNPSVYAERAEAYTALNKYKEAANDYMSAVRVISEQIQGATNAEAREDLSRRAMGYFEKSAALNLNMGDLESARSDLESAYTIAVALNDVDNIERLNKLISEMR